MARAEDGWEAARVVQHPGSREGVAKFEGSPWRDTLSLNCVQVLIIILKKFPSTHA